MSVSAKEIQDLLEANHTPTNFRCDECPNVRHVEAFVVTRRGWPVCCGKTMLEIKPR